ncbi:MAG: hypothetical protein ABIR48_01725 [Gammaproteobacteria bacterium]
MLRQFKYRKYHWCDHFCRAAWLALAALLLSCMPLRAMADLMLFPAVMWTQRSSIDNPTGDLKEYQLTPQLDIFYSADRGRLRFLGEVITSTEEPIDVERLQIGWLASSDTTLWLGRHHIPLGYWNTQFHHGAYLQNAVTRPAISEFEDDGGILPTHITGLLVEGDVTANPALSYVFSLGLGPSLDHGEGLEPVDLLHFSTSDHKLAATLRLSYQPELDTPMDMGIFISHNQIPSNLSGIDEIRQNIAGGYINWEAGALRIISEVYAVHNNLQGSHSSAGTFLNANLQVEYALGSSWTLYGRTENTFSDDSDPYLAQFPDYMHRHNLAGLRLEIDKQQALKLELGAVQLQNDHFNQLSIEWSAVFP